MRKPTASARRPARRVRAPKRRRRSAEAAAARSRVGEGRAGAGAQERRRARRPADAVPAPAKRGRDAGATDASPAAGAADASRRGEPRQVRLLHHRGGRPAEVRPDRHRRRSVRRLHRALQEPRRGRLRRAARGARLDARERARARAGQRDGDARAHGHPDVVRHDLQDARGHRRAAAVGGRSVRRRAEQDAEQARVRPQGAVGSRSGDPRGRGAKTRTSAG